MFAFDSIQPTKPAQQASDFDPFSFGEKDAQPVPEIQKIPDQTPQAAKFVPNPMSHAVEQQQMMAAQQMQN